MNNLQSTEWTDFRKCANEPLHLKRMTGVGNESFTPVNFQTKQRRVPTQINKRMIERFGACDCRAGPTANTYCRDGEDCCTNSWCNRSWF